MHIRQDSLIKKEKIMIRELQKNDYNDFIGLLDEFYHSSAVLHPVSTENYDITFNRCINGDKFTACFVDEENSLLRGYVLLSFTYSNEVGGICVWVEELYVKDEYRGHSIGTSLLNYVHEKYSPYAKRFRLEVTHSNHGAAKLYERMGYETLDYRQMTKDL